MDNQWIDCATIELMGLPEKGWKAHSGTYYAMDYAIEHIGQRDGRAISNYYPVNLESNLTPTWPAFLIDLLPQGYGRKELLKKLDRPEYQEEEADWILLKAGASNPIGNLRVKEALNGCSLNIQMRWCRVLASLKLPNGVKSFLNHNLHLAFLFRVLQGYKTNGQNYC